MPDSNPLPPKEDKFEPYTARTVLFMKVAAAVFLCAFGALVYFIFIR